MSFLKKKIINLISDTRIWQKFIVAFVFVVLIPMLFIGYISYRVVDARLIEEGEARLSIALDVLRLQYYVRANQMKFGMLQATTMENIKKAVKRGESAYLKKTMQQWKLKRSYVDLWAVVDANGIIVSTLEGDLKGEELKIAGVISEVLSTQETIISTEILSKNIIRGDRGSLEASPDDASSVMVLMVVTPIIEDGLTLGAIVTGDVINEDTFLPDLVAFIIKGVYSSINMGLTSISTNIETSGGVVLSGEVITPIYAETLKRRGFASGFLELLDKPYIVRLEPLSNNKGDIIGSVLVGMPHSDLWVAQEENAKVMIGVTVLGLIFAFFVALFAIYRFTAPLKLLTRKNKAFAEGDMTVRMPEAMTLGKRDELAVLARAFNSMMSEVEQRGVDTIHYLGVVQSKNADLVTLNKELESLRDRLRLIYDGIDDFILLYDRDYNLIEVNRAFVESCNVNPKNIKGTKCFNTYGCAADEFPKDCLLVEASKKKETISRERVFPDGRTFQVHIFPQLDKNGEVELLVEHMRDVTEENLLKEQLIRADKLSSLGVLVSGVAHELNNPLTGILGFSELLLVSKNLDGKIVKRLRTINEEALRCKRIIQNLIAFTRSQKTEKALNNINKLVEEMIELRAYQLKTDSVRLSLSLEEDMPPVMVDAQQFEQVILNLINNAHHAIMDNSFDGGTLEVKTSKSVKSVMVEITDSGGGMDEGTARKVFDPFFTTKEVGKGTGLGLSISYGIVSEHGGEITLDTELGKGSTFRVELPIPAKIKAFEPKEEKGIEPSSRELPLLPENLRALIVDDEKIVRDVITSYLKKMGVRADTSKDGFDALIKLKGNKYDIILSDLKMAKMDGKEFYEKILLLHPELKTRVIFITGDSASVKKGANLKETGWLLKPFTFESLKAVVVERIL